MDVIPIELTDQFLELVGKGVRVFYLRRLTLLASKREGLHLSKTARNNVRILMAIDGRWFREVDDNFLVLRRVISSYRGLHKAQQRLTNVMKALDDDSGDLGKETVKFLENQKKDIAIIIVDETSKRIPAYTKAVEALAITGDNYLLAREALAELMTYVDFSKGIRKNLDYLGLYKTDGNKDKPKRYSGALLNALQRLTMALKGTGMIKTRDEKQTIKEIRRVIRERLEVIPA